jgi:thioesterase domain-containing protein
MRILRASLPEYMLPTSVVWLRSLPLNASGKIDRRALPPPGDAASARTRPRVPPRDMFELVLARIWERLLGVTEVGVFDHFFEQGGHSLLAARLVDEIERETGLAMPLPALFLDDTIAGLAKALRDGAPDLKAPILTIRGEGSLPPFVFLHGDFTGGGFYSRSLAHALGPEQPVLIVHPHGLVGDAIPDSIEAMAADRVRALRALRPHGPYVVGGHCNGATVAFEMARQLTALGEDVPAVVIIEARAPAGQDRPREHAADEAYVTFDGGGVRRLTPRDRVSDALLRYAQAMDRYTGGHFPGHLIAVRARDLVDPRPEMGWSRYATSVEVHVLPGDHRTLVSRHVGELAQTLRAAIRGDNRRRATPARAAG